MAKWHFWGDKQFASVYENIYIRTFVEDWFKIVFAIIEEINGAKTILDIGCGEGHTTKQILDRLHNGYVCDILEPDRNALTRARSFLALENNIRKCHATTLANFKTKEKYDIVFTSHTNYYWTLNEKDYKNQLRKLIPLADKNGRIMILTLPKESDHYNIAVRQIYPPFVYSGYIVSFYRHLGLNVKTKRFRMRLYVGDILNNRKTYDLKNFYRFIHNTEPYPSETESRKFLMKIKKFQRNGYLDFKDELITVKIA